MYHGINSACISMGMISQLLEPLLIWGKAYIALPAITGTTILAPFECQVTAIHLRIGQRSILSTFAQSSIELHPLDYIIGYQYHNINKGYWATCPVTHHRMWMGKCIQTDWINSLFLRYVKIISQVWFSNIFHELIYWPFSVKLVLYECHRTPKMMSHYRSR